MVLDGQRTELKLRGNLLIGAAVANQRNDFQFPRTQPGGSSATRYRHVPFRTQHAMQGAMQIRHQDLREVDLALARRFGHAQKNEESGAFAGKFLAAVRQGMAKTQTEQIATYLVLSIFICQEQTWCLTAAAPCVKHSQYHRAHLAQQFLLFPGIAARQNFPGKTGRVVIAAPEDQCIVSKKTLYDPLRPQKILTAAMYMQ